MAIHFTQEPQVNGDLKLVEHGVLMQHTLCCLPEHGLTARQPIPVIH